MWELFDIILWVFSFIALGLAYYGIVNWGLKEEDKQRGKVR